MFTKYQHEKCVGFFHFISEAHLFLVFSKMTSAVSYGLNILEKFLKMEQKLKAAFLTHTFSAQPKDFQILRKGLCKATVKNWLRPPFNYVFFSTIRVIVDLEAPFASKIKLHGWCLAAKHQYNVLHNRDGVFKLATVNLFPLDMIFITLKHSNFLLFDFVFVCI